MKTNNDGGDATVATVGTEFFNDLWEESWTYIKTVVDIVREPVLILDKELHAVHGEFLIARFAGGDFHRVGHAGAAAGLDIDAQALVLRVGLADDFGDMPGGAFGQGDRRQSGFCHKTILKQALSLSMQGR